MTNRLELNWKLDGFVDEQRYYCSETPIDLDNLPVPKAILAGDARSHVEMGLTIGKYYHIGISAYKNGIEKFSEFRRILFGKAWSPHNLANTPKIWLNSENVIKDTANRISQLTDVSGNSLHFSQSNNDNKPVLHRDTAINHDVVRFDGVNDFLSVVSVNAANLFKNVSSAFIFCVVKRRGAVGNGGIFYAPNGTSAGLSRINLNMQSNNVQFSTRRQDADSTDNLLSVVSSSDYQIVAASVNYDTGVKKIYSNSTLTEKSVTIGRTSDTSGHNQTIRVGVASIYDTGGALNMDLLDIIVTSNLNVTDADRQKLEGWAAHKYGLTGNLPTDHPYKMLVPTI